jgi:hypothetical protein
MRCRLLLVEVAMVWTCVCYIEVTIVVCGAGCVFMPVMVNTNRESVRRIEETRRAKLW